MVALWFQAPTAIYMYDHVHVPLQMALHFRHCIGTRMAVRAVLDTSRVAFLHYCCIGSGRECYVVIPVALTQVTWKFNTQALNSHSGSLMPVPLMHHTVCTCCTCAVVLTRSST